MFFFFSSRRRHTRLQGDWSSDVCSSDLKVPAVQARQQVELGPLLVGCLLGAAVEVVDGRPLWLEGCSLEDAGQKAAAPILRVRLEERRVGEEGRSRGVPDHLKKKKKDIE